jgi:hypothetical protein
MNLVAFIEQLQADLQIHIDTYGNTDVDVLIGLPSKYREIDEETSTKQEILTQSSGQYRYVVTVMAGKEWGK